MYNITPLFKQKESKILEGEFWEWTHVSRLYLRYFDVVMRGNQPMPNATVKFRSKPEKIDIVPVVYIMQECLKKQNHELPRLILQRIIRMSETNHIAIHEIQIDCDWTLTSRNSFFRFMTTLRQLAHQKELKLSTTVRLHQLNLPVPPADRGILMYYNTGDVTDYHEKNPILDTPPMMPYLRHLPDFDLPLSTAYPLFSWKVLYRNKRFVGILYKGNEYPVIQGDEIINRQPTFRKIIEAHNAVHQLRPEANDEVILYDLQPANINKFSKNEIEQIFNH